jgi:DNA-binding response OmpR family regulator
MIRRVRRKLEAQELDAEEHLITVPGVGYRLG